LKKNGIVAVFLAAGKSRRMGKNKLLLPLRGTTVGNSSLQKALTSVLDQIIVVTRAGEHLDWIDSELFQNPLENRWTPVTCQDAEKGQAHSLRCGLRAAVDRDPLGIMVLLADQPFLSTNLINDLVLTYKKLCMGKNHPSFLAASYQGIPRPPIIFSRDAVPELLNLKGDEGARKYLQKQKQTGIFVEYENDWDFFDIDTREDYEGAKGAGTRHD
jgi:molybdenum cofactor cytidylyltransferase